MGMLMDVILKRLKKALIRKQIDKTQSSPYI